MPYIAQNLRPRFDSEINELIEKLREEDHDVRDGAVNYVISRIAVGTYRPASGRWRYWMVHACASVFDRAREEFVRRIYVLCEDRAIENNGDLPEYEET